MSATKAELIDPAFRDLIATRIDRQYNRVYHVQGTAQALMEVLEQHYCTSEEGQEKYTSICSVMCLLVDTLGDIANRLEPAVILEHDKAGSVGPQEPESCGRDPTQPLN